MNYTGSYIAIEPGEIAILSTKERLNMPENLVGKIGIRLDAALKGLVGLMGIQVDPCMGKTKTMNACISGWPTLETKQ